MTDAITIATHLLKANPHIGKVQLQKLLYLGQGWSLAWRGERLFDDEIQAWKLGPVVPTAYEWHREGSLLVDDPPIDEDARAIIDAVFDTYGHLSGDELIAITHEDNAWLAARSGCGPEEACDRVIEPGDLMRSFAQQSLAGEGPARPILSNRGIPPDHLDEAADRIAQEWATALKLLAE